MVSEKTLQDMPIEVLLELFEYMDKRSLWMLVKSYPGEKITSAVKTTLFNKYQRIAKNRTIEAVQKEHKKTPQFSLFTFHNHPVTGRRLTTEDENNEETVREVFMAVSASWFQKLWKCTVEETPFVEYTSG